MKEEGVFTDDQSGSTTRVSWTLSEQLFKNMKGTLLHEDKEEDLESLNMS